jgi:Flp pilus assembly protein TadG
MSASDTTIDDRRCAGERGGAIVELALALPILAILVLGIAEYGTIWQQQSTLTRAAQSAARTGAGQGTLRMADYNAIQQMEAGLAGIDNIEVERVVIYRADTADGGVPATCKNMAITDDLNAKGNSGSHCNVYSPAQVAFEGSVLSHFGTNASSPPTCAANSWDHFWCPLGRSRGSDITDPDYLGVYVNTTYTPMTSLLGTPEIDIDADVAFRLDPCITGVNCGT